MRSNSNYKKLIRSGEQDVYNSGHYDKVTIQLINMYCLYLLYTVHVCVYVSVMCHSFNKDIKLSRNFTCSFIA